MTKEVIEFSDEWDDSVIYIKEVIEALYENSDPVSVEAGELLERIVAKQEQDEPVGKFAKFTDGIWREVTDGSAGVPLYTHPKEWVGLTEKQIDDIYYKSNLNIDDQYNQMYEFVKAIELAHGIKD